MQCQAATDRKEKASTYLRNRFSVSAAARVLGILAGLVGVVSFLAMVLASGEAATWRWEEEAAALRFLADDWSR